MPQSTNADGEAKIGWYIACGLAMAAIAILVVAADKFHLMERLLSTSG
ncbi:MAG TPA: hypothetical protein VFY28_02430 [Candidatus Paceibacterota bacterium]|nr:hypothetical protein [Candidatus Paceibacterota bacterium]